jgi:hypothetical protein
VPGVPGLSEVLELPEVPGAGTVSKIDLGVRLVGRLNGSATIFPVGPLFGPSESSEWVGMGVVEETAVLQDCISSTFENAVRPMTKGSIKVGSGFMRDVRWRGVSERKEVRWAVRSGREGEIDSGMERRDGSWVGSMGVGLAPGVGVGDSVRDSVEGTEAISKVFKSVANLVASLMVTLNPKNKGK